MLFVRVLVVGGLGKFTPSVTLRAVVADLDLQSLDQVLQVRDPPFPGDIPHEIALA